jgi:hypothetical protein
MVDEVAMVRPQVLPTVSSNPFQEGLEQHAKQKFTVETFLPPQENLVPPLPPKHDIEKRKFELLHGSRSKNLSQPSSEYRDFEAEWLQKVETDRQKQLALKLEAERALEYERKLLKEQAEEIERLKSDQVLSA